MPSFDLWVMVAVVFACLPVFLPHDEIGRRRGLMFLVISAAYVAYLILGAQDDDALDAGARYRG